MSDQPIAMENPAASLLTKIDKPSVSIGIIAWNEASSITATIQSVFAQSLFNGRIKEFGQIEILCVPNGCTDETATLAHQALARGCPVGVGYAVHELDIASKENAWNVFVHRLSCRDSQYLILLDGDVAIGHVDTLANLVQALENDREARIAGATTFKHIEGKFTLNPVHVISAAASKLRKAQPGMFAGCCYCARSEVLRSFTLPSILVGEDSFINAMVSTDGFLHPANPRRIVRPDNATVRFEAYLNPVAVYKNLRRRMVELIINSMIYDELWLRSTAEQPAGALLKLWDKDDPEWGAKLICKKTAERGRWLFGRRMVTGWVQFLKRVPWYKRPILIPVVALATVLNLFAAISASRAIRQGRCGGLWFSTRTSAVTLGVTQ